MNANDISVTQNLILNENHNAIMKRLHYLLQNVRTVSSDLIDKDLLDEIKSLAALGSSCIYFGKTLGDLKCVIQDDDGLREHEILVKYKAPKKLVISSVKLPYSPLQDQEYTSIEEIITSFKKYINDLVNYFYELEHIDNFCTVMEPVTPTFKDDYRRILLDDRTWLHVEVTTDGLATNIHLVGRSERWHDKLQTGLICWDHDKDIVENIMTVFDIENFPVCSKKTLIAAPDESNVIDNINIPTCGICLCDKLPDNSGVPQPLCQNTTCGVYFHRSCLYQWLVACSGSRAPAFGVATGACPTCLQPIACNATN